MRKKISVTFTIVGAIALVMCITASGQTRRRQQQPKRPQPTATPTASPKERARRELIKLIDLAVKAEAAFKSKPSSNEFTDINNQMLVVLRGSAFQFNADDSTLQVATQMVGAYFDAANLYRLATYKAPPINEYIQREEANFEAERERQVKRIQDLRRRAFGEYDPIKRRELNTEASLEESQLEYRRSVLPHEKLRRAEEARRKETEENGRQAALILDKYALKDKWAGDSLKAVQAVIDFGASLRLELMKKLEGK